ncbi:MAG: hypothetical protein ACLQPH_21555 [Acidimicrobiales bacterium]
MRASTGASATPGPAASAVSVGPDPVRSVGDWLLLSLWAVAFVGVVVVAGVLRRTRRGAGGGWPRCSPCCRPP